MTTPNHAVEQTPSGFTVTVQHEVSRQRIGDLLCSAFEGGSNYWYRIEEFHAPTTYQFRTFPESLKVFKHIDYPLNPDGYLVVSDFHGCDEPETEIKKRKLNFATIKRGLKLLSQSKEYSHHWRDFLAENDDQITADVFLQFCLFGEVVYG